MKIQRYSCLFVCAKVEWSKLLQLLVKMHPTAYPLFSCGPRHNKVLRGATWKKSCSFPVNPRSSHQQVSRPRAFHCCMAVGSPWIVV
ncbi:Piso0_000786 [Millerozyma farinosa CBS 7064]|uniref:Piso0_000786 protein n=1 Tax=Pichia sorbitophila (strain ATCC MYA-4447 / BCRC 22081 / CBS 7064 / NBRC 10061 / NRRL Y-12695) TaxID=559304 RepID=G8YRI3_PICSO|nr:Piso0_000786 [Millerozyma farinosa CBS 7064]